VSCRCGTTVDDLKRRWLWVPAFAGTTATRLGICSASRRVYPSYAVPEIIRYLDAIAQQRPYAANGVRHQLISQLILDARRARLYIVA
jgi:hypothetical protein